MRFRRLDLEKYGPFTGRALEFSGTARLHVVYGPNEAGKSSALQAVTDLLFGFEHRARNDFLHNAPELRVGATLAAAGDGGAIAFRRRRGNKNTLIDAEDKPLPDDALLPFLGGMTREIFTRAFGLSTETMRQGAEEMLKSEGDLGATLFAAASGMKGLNDLRRGLEQEAETIFAARASQNRRFYQALQRHDEARRAIRDTELKAGDWKELNQAIEDLGERLAGVGEDKRRAVEDRTRLSRLKRVAPCLRLIDEMTEELARLAGLPETPAGFADDLEARLDKARTAREAHARALEAKQRCADAHAAIAVDTSMLGRSAEIADLTQRSGACADSRRDLPRVQAQADQKARELDHLAVRLGLKDRESLRTAQPADAAMARAQALIEEGRALADTRRLRAEDLRDARDQLQHFDRQRGEAGRIVDPRPLRDRLGALAPDLRRVERTAELRRERDGRARDLAEAVARLVPEADLDRLARAPLPGETAIARFREAEAAAAAETARLSERQEETWRAIADLDREVAALASGRPVPSREAIAEARTARAAQWQPLRDRLQGRDGGVTPDELPAAIVAFERAVDAADDLADEAGRDADRVARHGVAVAELERLKGVAEEFASRLAVLREAAEAREAEWRALWAPVTDVPGSPAEMTAWLRDIGDLLSRRTELAGRSDEIEELVALESRLVPLLSDLAREAGVSGLNGAGAGVLAHAIEERLRALGDVWERAREIETRRRDAEARIARLEALAGEDEAASARWQQAWSRAAPAIGLPADAAVADAEIALQLWRQAPGLFDAHQDLERRVNGMERNLREFAESLRALAAELAPDKVEAAPEHVLQLLRERLDEAKERRTRKAEAAARLEEADAAHAHAEEDRQRAETALREAAAIFPGEADLSDVLRRLQAREGWRARLAEQHQRLVEQGDGVAEEALRADLASFDPDAAEARMSGLRDEEQRLDADSHSLHSERDRQIERRRSLETGIGAERAALEKAGAETEIAVAARDWMVLRLGALMVSAAVERHRAGNEDPLMRRAGELFATVTGGRFSGLDQDYDDADTPRLVGRRAEGNALHLAGMSEGTRDQLYLALRLAYLEDYARRAEPVPFIGDDLFSTFDDERTENGLRVLGTIGAAVQPILFTHHRRVAELARAALGEAVEVIELR